MQQRPLRWKLVALAAARRKLVIRWQVANEEWLAARAEYFSLFDAERVDVASLCEAAHRLREVQDKRRLPPRELPEV